MKKKASCVILVVLIAAWNVAHYFAKPGNTAEAIEQVIEEELKMLDDDSFPPG